MISHDLVFMADLYDVAGAMVVRANGPVVRGKNALAPPLAATIMGSVTHELLDDHGAGFWREDLGVFVVNKIYLREVT